MNIELSVVMPCLNEAETLAICIKKAQGSFIKNNIKGEVVIADNGSTDGSIEIAKSLNARVIHVKDKGYGNALKGGIKEAYGIYVIMGDADDSYDFSNLTPHLEKLREGFDLVMGNRFKGGIKKGAMPFLHKYLGNPVLSFLGRLFFKIPIGDFHCGLRGFRKDAFYKMNLQTTGMEFASEMIVKSKLNDLKIAEVPTILSPDGRTRPPHLNTWSDGWRHLRFLLLYSPNWLFLIPGIILLITGTVTSTIITLNPIQISDITFDVHTLLYSATAIIIAFQFILFYGLTKIYAVENNLLPKSKRYNKLFDYINLEKGLIFGILLVVLGLFLTGFSINIWSETNFSNLDPTKLLRYIIPAIISLQLGVQIVLFSLFFSILGLKNN